MADDLDNHDVLDCVAAQIYEGGLDINRNTRLASHTRH